MSLEKIAQSYQPVAEINTSGLYQLCTGGTHIKIMPLSGGMSLSDGLRIGKVGKNTVTLKQDFGPMIDLYTFHPDGHGAIRNIYKGAGKGKELRKNSW